MPSLPNAIDVDARLDSLRQLLDDPSPRVGDSVAKEFARLGRRGRPELRRALRSDSPRARLRARSILGEQGRALAARRLLRFVLQKPGDLERGLWLLSRFGEPGLDVRPFLVALDALGAQLAGRVESLPPGRPRCRELVAYLGRELGFGGCARPRRTTDDVHLHRAIMTKRGLPLTLSALFLFVARRAGLNGGLVAMPGHVILRLFAPEGDVFVDPYRGGAALEPKDLLAYLARHGCSYTPNMLECASERDLLARQIRNLQLALRESQRRRESRALDPVLRVLVAAPRG